MQTYFSYKSRINYFIVVESAIAVAQSKSSSKLPATKQECLEKIKKDFESVKGDIVEQASIVQGFGDSKSAQVPWLEKTAFPSHLAGLTNNEIKGSFKLLSKKTKDNKDKDLRQILDTAEALFQDAYQLCSNASPNRKMTQQRANILNEFYTGASGKSDSFRYYKNASTLANYLRIWKQLLTYYYRVVYSEDSHFSKASPEQRVPKDVIECTR